MKKFVKYLLVVCLMIPFAFMFAGCGEPAPANVMTMSVNPKVSFVLDANNNVTSVKYENDDAGVLYADINFVGKDLDSTIQLFIERSAISGHINIKGSTVDIDISGKSSADVDALKQKAQAQVEEVFKSLGVTVSVNLKELSETAQKQALLATAKALAPEMSTSELEEMSSEELLKVINNKQKEYEGLVYSQVKAIEEQFSMAKSQVLQLVATTRETLESVEAQLNGLLETYKDVIPAAIQKQIDALRTQIKELKAKIEENVNKFLDAKKAEIADAKKQLSELKTKLVNNFKAQVAENKATLIAHLDVEKEAGHITEEQYNYWVNLINAQTNA